MPHGDVKFDPSHGDVFPCSASNCEQTKHNINKFSVYCIRHLMQKLPSKTSYRRKDKGGDGSGKKTRKKM